MRTVIKIAAEQGMGVESTGMIIIKALKNMGYHIFAEREFNSLIKGGKSNIQINFDHKPVRGISQKIDIGIAFDREGLKDCLETVRPGGVIIHGFERWNKVIKDLPKIEEEKKLKIIQVPAREIAINNGGGVIMVNVVLLGFLWQILGLDLEILKTEISQKFKNKEALIPINHKCTEAGFEFTPENQELLNSSKSQFEHILDEVKKLNKTAGQNRIIIDGNSAIALGAIQAGVRNYYAYPMSPSTSILVYLAKVASKYGMLVKQAEDEITVAQLTLGSMHAGSRSICATSGGGYDLMTETVSLAGMIETPWVCVVVQRPGPATGLPTWTGQADLQMVIHSAHGEFAKIVIAVSDPNSAFTEIQHALNLSEKYQLPVTVLSEAAIGMSYTSEEEFDSQIPIQRHISIEKENLDQTQQVLNYTTETATSQDFIVEDKLEPTDRYKLTPSGISKRWIPGSSKTTYFANGDEHLEDGSLTEDSLPSKLMIEKRIKKIDIIKNNLPSPEVYTLENGLAKLANNPEKITGKIGIIGWGSTKNPVLDAIENMDDSEINYLHYTYMWPLKTELFNDFVKNHEHILLIEGNYNGQLGQLLHGQTEFRFQHKLLKWDGRSFHIEEITKKIEELLN